ncbi:MAG: SMP-30/gluconolactonase/LRE family protein, partial [Pseudomonadota bacterium]
NRPECALAHRSGLTLVPDWTGKGGVAAISPSGATRRIEADRPLRPNGISLEPGGAILLAHLGDDDGGLWRLHPDGRTEPVLTEIGGTPVPPSNFPLRDAEGRIWLTISTTVRPRSDDYRSSAETGFVVLIDEAGPRTIAEGLGYANECALSADGRTLFVNETFARRTAAFDVAADGSLSRRRTVASYGEGVYPDGLALDVDGGLWITSIVSNRVIRVAPDGSQTIVLDDVDAATVEAAEAAWREDRLGPEHLKPAPAATLKALSNLAFAGDDRRDALLGCLHGDRIARFRAPVAGLAPSWWDADLGPLARYLN